MRLIDADALRVSAIKATNNDEFDFDNCFPYWRFSKCIKEAPTIDAAPVVRCCDCGHWDKLISFMGAHACAVWSQSRNLPRYTQGQDYCSCGSRGEV